MKKLEGLLEIIWTGVQELKQQRAATATEMTSKFAAEDGTFEMAYGSLDLFYKGLEGLGENMSPRQRLPSSKLAVILWT